VDSNPDLSATDLLNIIAIYNGVKEDFAPFDVDVTTEDDGSTPAIRVVLGGTGTWFNDSSAGGVAVHNGFSTPADQPVFVFTAVGSLSHPKLAQEAATHYIGHSLGLVHKGAGVGKPYYTGHGVWAPIMGRAYNKEVTQWSKGAWDRRGLVTAILSAPAPLHFDRSFWCCCSSLFSRSCSFTSAPSCHHLPLSTLLPCAGEYPNADNTDDEVQIIAAKLPLLSPIAGTTLATATALNATLGAGSLYTAIAEGVVGSPSKTHYYAFTAPVAGWLNLKGVPAPPWTGGGSSALMSGYGQANLNIKLELFNASSGLLLASNETDATLEARISFKANVTGDFVVALTGAGSTLSKFSDYGSMGAYSLTASWPAITLPPPPPPPRRPRRSPPPPPLPSVQNTSAAFASNMVQPRIVIVSVAVSSIVVWRE